MNVTDPIADLLTRIRNAAMVRHQYTMAPASKLKVAVVAILKDEGYIKGYDLIKEGPQKQIRIWLKYTPDKKSVVTGLKRVSRPGLRVYSQSRTMPRVLGGLGIAIVSTPQGIMTSDHARRLRVGGEVLCYIW